MLRRSPLRPQSARTIEQRSLREATTAAVLRRDRYACMVRPLWPELPECRGKLDPHHTFPTSRFPERRHDIDGMLTACRLHHDALHSHPAEARERGLLH